MQKEISSILTLSMTASVFTLSYTGLMLIMPATSLLFIPNTVLAGIIAASAAITDGYIYGKNINQGISRFFKEVTSLDTDIENDLLKILFMGSITAASIGAGFAVASSAFELLMMIYPSLLFSATAAPALAMTGIFVMSAIASVSFFFTIYNVADDLYQCKTNHLNNWYTKLSNPEYTYNYLLLAATASLAGLYSLFTFAAWQNKVYEITSFLPFAHHIFSDFLIISYTFWESISTFGNAFTAMEELTDNPDSDSESESEEENRIEEKKSPYENFYNDVIKPIVFATHTIGEACVINIPGPFALISTFVSFTIKNLAEFNQFLGWGYHHHHEHENNNSEKCAFGHSHDDNPIDYVLCELPRKAFGI